MKWFTHFSGRRLEWCLAIYTVTFGVWIALPSESMSSPGFRSALSLMTEREWGALYIVVGMIHNIALHVNGRAAWTPFARVGAVFLNGQVFLAMALAIAQSSPWSSGVLTYGFFSTFFCGVALIAAAQDCGRELRIWKERRDGGN